jgi:hypothetical protein
VPTEKRTGIADRGGDTGVKRVTHELAERGEKASPEKWKKIKRRASELAMLDGKTEPDEKHARRAKRELLGVQTSAEKPSGTQEG